MILAFLAGMFLILHSMFSEDENYTPGSRIFCFICGLCSVGLSIYMHSHP